MAHWRHSPESLRISLQFLQNRLGLCFGFKALLHHTARHMIEDALGHVIEMEGIRL